MADLLSPGVQIQEIDASGIAPTVSSSTGVFCGDFKQGPVGVPMRIANINELVQYYGEPTNTNYNDFFQAKTFLDYGNQFSIKSS